VPVSLLVVDDRPEQVESLRTSLIEAGVPAGCVLAARTGREALAALGPEVAVALCDLSFETIAAPDLLGGDAPREGIAIALALRRAADQRGLPVPEIFLHTAFPSEVRSDALPGIHVATLSSLDAPLGRVVAAYREREREMVQRRAVVDRGWMSLLRGVWTPSLLALADTIGLAAVHPHLPVLVTGPTGVGKEAVARVIHDAGRALGARAGELVSFSGAALSETIAESELFGHERGAFTGAERKHEGLFVRAQHGTLVLDEVHTLPVNLQLKLLRAISPGMVRPVGGFERPVSDVRIVAMSSADLAEEVEAGRFGRDLYYRLLGIAIDLPALTGRPEDVRALSRHFVASAPGEGPREMSAELEEDLASSSWEGNARQLRHAVLVARARAHARGATRIERQDHAAAGVTRAGGESRYAALVRTHEDQLRLLAVEAWRTAQYSLQDAARASGMPKTTLWRRLREQADLWRRREGSADPDAIAMAHALDVATVRRLLELG